MMNNESDQIKDMKSPRWQISLSILVGVGWLAFLLIWFFFYTDKYNWEKHVAIILLSILILFGILGVPWMLWWQKHRSLQEIEMWKTQGFKGRVWISGIAVVLTLFFLIYWFWYQALPYPWYQNLIIFIVSFLVIGGILGAMWAPWGMKHDQKKCQQHEEEK